MTTIYMMKRFQNIRTNIFRSLMVVALIVCGVGQSWGENYVFMYNGYFAAYSGSGTALSAPTEFTPNTCIWVGNSGSSFYNYGTTTRYLTLGSNSATATTSTSNLTIINNRIYRQGRSNYYLRYNNGWTAANNTNNTATPYKVEIKSNNASITAPTVTGSAVTLSAVDATATFTASSSTYTPAYTTYAFNGTTYYSTDSGTSATQGTGPTASSDGITYSWSLSSELSPYAKINDDGTVTVTSLPTGTTDAVGTVICKATKTVNGVTTESSESTASLTIEYAKTPHTITVTQPASGGTISASATSALPGATVTLTSTPNTGYEFKSWTVTDADGNAITVANNRFTMPNSAVTVTATFALQNFQIQTAVTPTGAGTVTGAGTYEYGSTATLTATANAGYRFSKWNDDNTNSTRTVTVTAATTYTATFVAIPYSITVTQPATGGTISASATSAVAGTTIKLTATPATNYGLESWTVKDASNNTITVTNNQFTMPTSNVTVTATFVKTTTIYYITSNYTGLNSGTHSGEHAAITDDGSSTPKWDIINGQSTANLWEVTTTASGYTFKNVATGNYIVASARANCSTTSTSSSATAFSRTELSSGHYLFGYYGSYYENYSYQYGYSYLHARALTEYCTSSSYQNPPYAVMTAAASSSGSPSDWNLYDASNLTIYTVNITVPAGYTGTAQLTYTGSSLFPDETATKTSGETLFIDSKTAPTSSQFTSTDIDTYKYDVVVDGTNHTITVKYSLAKLPTTLSFASVAPTISGSGIQLPAVTLKDKDGNTVSGDITYTATGCTVSNTGLVTNITGNATVTASYAGDDDYAASSATYEIKVTDHAALNENTCTDIAITPASATLASGTQDYSVPKTVNAETHTQDAYTEYTFPVGTLYKLNDGTLSTSAPEVKIETGQALNFVQVNWSFNDGAGNYYNPSTYYSAETNILTLTRGTGLTSTDKTFTITATVVYGSVTKTATATVTIPYTEVDLTSFQLTSNNMTIAVDETAQISYSYQPNYDSAGKPHIEITYSGYDTNIIDVDKNGKVTGLKEGSTTVTLTTKKIDGSTGFTTQIAVEVSNGTGTSTDPYKISSVSGLNKIKDNLNSSFIVTGDFDASSFTGSIDGFTGTLDGNFHVISGLSTAIFNTISSGTVKNVILDNVTISGSGNIGAIANQASGSVRIYNCGVLAHSGTSTISGTGYVGSIVGVLYSNARVINCFSYANITGGSEVGGIVGYNSTASTSDNLQTMIMNCMFYGDITGANTIAPIYGGYDITNAGSTGLNNYNYYRYSANIDIDKYNTALAAEEKYLDRFEFYRGILNSNKALCAYYITGNASDANIVAKWVIDTDLGQYPVLKPYGTKWQSSIYRYRTNADAPTATEAKKGKVLTDEGNNGYLSVTIKHGDNGSGSDVTVQLPITDMNYDTYDYNYAKVVLPYYNDYFTGNYTNNKVVTGWMVSVSGGTNSFAKSGTDAYNFADRKSTEKDNYSKSGRVFAQGGYFNVPEGVSSITITAKWGNAIYLSDAGLDVSYTTDYSGTLQGSRYTSGRSYSINGSNQAVYTSLSDAMGQLTNVSTVYDQAIVLVGNYHTYNETWTSDGYPFTLMSADLDGDDEPDNCVFHQHTDRKDIDPVRFDFLWHPGIGMAHKCDGTTQMPNQGIWHPRGWFEVTETCLARYTEFEYDETGDQYGNNYNAKTKAPVILNGGIFEQFVSSQYAISNKTQYFILGGNLYMKGFTPGTHNNGSAYTEHCPVSVVGGEYKEFYLSGTMNAAATVYSNEGDVMCYTNGGKFGTMAGAGQEQIDANIWFKIDHSVIDEFYGGGVNNQKPITGKITTVINHSEVSKYCGGPKFGNMQNSNPVETTADGTTFGVYYGAGNGGTSLYRERKQNAYNAQTYDWNSWLNSYYTQAYESGKGIQTQPEYEYFAWAGGSTSANVGRIFIYYASFDVAKTNDVKSTLNNCKVTTNFYGGGNLGTVSGKVESSLTGCNVTGNVFGGGFSASVPTADVYPIGNFKTVPTYDGNVGVYGEGEFNAPTQYTWSHVASYNGTYFDHSNHLIYTTEDMSNLGTVQGNITLTVTDGSVGGSVFGGGDESPASANTDVKILGTANIAGNVYGGGNEATVGGTTTVQIGDVCE